MHHPRQDSTYHGLCYTSRGALAGITEMSEVNMYSVKFHVFRMSHTQVIF